LHNIHVEAPAHLALLCRKLLAAGAPGGIINILDIFADFPRKGFLPYCASKAGLKAVTRQLALELAPDVLVNGVAPGAILEPEAGLDADTRSRIEARIPLGRFGQADDVAGAVLFLAQARYITGQVIVVDGGRSINI
jgi:pteridine reductase